MARFLLETDKERRNKEPGDKDVHRGGCGGAFRTVWLCSAVQPPNLHCRSSSLKRTFSWSPPHDKPAQSRSSFFTGFSLTSLYLPSLITMVRSPSA